MTTHGVDVRQHTDRLIFRASLKDGDGEKVPSGTTELRILRLEDDGTLDVYDWTTNDFVAPGSGTPDDETTMTQRQRRDSSGADVDTGIWTLVLSTLTNFAIGQIYFAVVTNSGASPETQEREFQFGGVEGQQSDSMQVNRNADLIESQRGEHTWQGNWYYVDPVNGNDSTGDGSRLLPYATIQAAHDDLVTDSNRDVIFLVAGGVGQTVHTVAATTTISKRFLSIRGPGRDFDITRTGNGDTISITADGVQISGCQINTAATGVGIGILVTGADFVKINNVWFQETRGHGVELDDCDNFVLCDCSFQSTGASGAGDGLNITAATGETSSYGRICRNHFDDVQGDGIRLNPSGTGAINATRIFENPIQGCTENGIEVTGTGAVETQIHDNRFGNNSGVDISDAGTNTILLNNEQWAKQEILADTVWDEPQTAATHNVPTSSGRRLRQIDTSITSDIAQGPGTGNNQIQLAATETAVDGMFDPTLIYIAEGTGAGQSRNIFQYAGATRTATVDRNWKINPDDTSVYVILADAGREHVNEGLAQAGTTNTITLNALASATDGAYRNQYVFVRSGTGEDQVRRCSTYNGTTKVATVSRDWDVTPDTTSAYAMLPMACVEVQAVVDTDLDTKVGSNFDIFFQNADADTVKVVDDVGSGAGLGDGANIITITVDDGVIPTVLENATVRYSLAGVTKAKANTDVNGLITSFNLNDATYDVSITIAGYTFAGTTHIVAGDSTPTYSVTLIAATPPADPSLCLVQVKCIDENGVVEGNVTVFMRIKDVPDDDTGIAYDGQKLSDETGVDGIANLTCVRGATYFIERGDRGGETVAVIPTDQDVVTLPSIIGKD